MKIKEFVEKNEKAIKIAGGSRGRNCIWIHRVQDW